MHDAMLEASKLDATVFRNNIGVAIYPDGAHVAYGLCPGSSDIIGWSPLVITQDMVGRTVALFTAIETKSHTGRKQDNQKNFIEQVQAAGGRAGFAKTLEDVRKILSKK